MRPIRNSAKALIIREGKLLVTRNLDSEGEFYLLPGGGQNPGEPLDQALIREVLEETGAEVRVGGLRFVRDYISRNHEFCNEDPNAHQIEYMFQCDLITEPGTHPVTEPDQWQDGVEWIPLSDFQNGLRRLYPKILGSLLESSGIPPHHPVYLGDVN